MALGLVSSEQIDDYWSQTSRRRVLYEYPNGTAPLMALLSLSETKETAHPETGWWEERWNEIFTLTATGPTSNTTFYLGGTTTTAGTTFTPTTDTAYRMYVTTGEGSTKFQVDDMIKVFGLQFSSAGTKVELSFRVTATSANYLELIQTSATLGAAITNNSATTGINLGNRVVYAGSAYAEASRSRTGRYTVPIEAKNYTQIFKTPWEMSGTALKEPLKYDKSGDYRTQYKKNGINHFAGIERTMFFGDRKVSTATDEDTGSTVRRGHMGGVLWFLKQWELGNVVNGGAFDYRPGGADVTTQTDYITYTDKRIIRLAGATITTSSFNRIMSRLFERTLSSEWDKLCLCGPDYMAAVAESYERRIQVTSLRDNGFDGYTFKLVKHESNSGTVWYKQHPLFNSPEMRASAFYMDLGATTYRPLTDRDSQVMPMIQLPDADKRKDQWLTECTLELNFPESCMYVENLGGITNG